MRGKVSFIATLGLIGLIQGCNSTEPTSTPPPAAPASTAPAPAPDPVKVKKASGIGSSAELDSTLRRPGK